MCLEKGAHLESQASHILFLTLDFKSLIGHKALYKLQNILICIKKVYFCQVFIIQGTKCTLVRHNQRKT